MVQRSCPRGWRASSLARLWLSTKRGEGSGRATEDPVSPPVERRVGIVLPPPEESSFTVALRRELHALPRRLREPVILRDIELLGSAEAAALLGLEETAFKSRLHRGRTRLCTVLGASLAGTPQQ